MKYGFAYIKVILLMILRNLRVLCIDSNVESRLRLKEFLRLVALKVEFFPFSHPEPACELLAENGPPFDTLFVGSMGEKADVHATLESLRSLNLESLPLNILIVRGDERSSYYISEFLLSGFDGILSEPYAIDELEAAIQVAESRRRAQKNKEDEEIKLSKVLLKEALSSIDGAAYHRLRSNRKGGGYDLKTMKALAPSLRELLEGRDLEQLRALIEEGVESSLQELDLELFRRKVRRVERALHPGAVLREVLSQRGIAVSNLANKLGLTEETMLLFIDGEAELTEPLAEDLARVVGNTKEYWFGLQVAYDRSADA